MLLQFLCISFLASPGVSLLPFRSVSSSQKTLQRMTSRSAPVLQPPPPSSQSDQMKLGVLLLNLGGPEAMADVEGFLYNLFADPDIIRLPPLLSILQKPIAWVIAKRRAPKSSAAYESIGGGSPIVKYTGAQAQLLQEALARKGYDAKCYFAMRYWHPFTEEALSAIQKDGINTLVIVPLYPQYSISTSGSSLRVLQETFQKCPLLWGNDKIAHTVVPAWYYRDGYVSTMARLIVREMEAYSNAEAEEGMHVLFSAHGVPQSYIAAGDPYQRQIEECVRLVSSKVSELLLATESFPSSLPNSMRLMLARGDSAVRFHLSFQSRVGPVQWLQPYTEEKLMELGSSGVKNLVVVPVSFVSEHIETLEEIDMEYRELAEESGIRHWARVPALNTDAQFIADMSALVEEALSAPSLSVYEATPINSNDLSDGLMMGAQTERPAFGITEAAEKLNGRFAILGLLGTTLVEAVGGHPVLQMVGIR